MKGPQRFVAWVTVVADNIHPFVEFFNRNTDCAKKVLHGVKIKSESDIKVILGTTKVKNVLKKNNTAFVMESEGGGKEVPPTPS